MKFLDEKFFFQYFLNLENERIFSGGKRTGKSASTGPSAARGKKQRSLLRK
jgi:hypothetical protein